MKNISNVGLCGIKNYEVLWKTKTILMAEHENFSGCSKIFPQHFGDWAVCKRVGYSFLSKTQFKFFLRVWVLKELILIEKWGYLFFRSVWNNLIKNVDFVNLTKFPNLTFFAFQPRWQKLRRMENGDAPLVGSQGLRCASVRTWLPNFQNHYENFFSTQTKNAKMR